MVCKIEGDYGKDSLEPESEKFADILKPYTEKYFKVNGLKAFYGDDSQAMDFYTKTSWFSSNQKSHEDVYLVMDLDYSPFRSLNVL